MWLCLLLLNLSHQSHAVLEACLIRSSHLSGSGIAHAVEYLVEHFDLHLTQRIFKGYAELAAKCKELLS